MDGKMKFEDVKKDYLELMTKYGIPFDMTGGLVDSEHMEFVILNPNKTNAMNYMIKVINYGFGDGEFWRHQDSSDGFEDIPISSDEFLKEMYEKYC
jgi:hypothetical protein